MPVPRTASSRASLLRSFKAQRLARVRQAFLEARARRVMAARMGAVVRPGPRAGYGRVGPSGMEFKVKDTSLSGPVDQTTARYYLLNGTSRGSDIGNRNGRKITVRSVQINLGLEANAGGTSQWHRVMLVVDRQPNGVALDVAQVLQTVSPFAVRNLENRKRFNILYDHTFWILPGGINGSLRMIKYYKKMFLDVTYNTNDAGTIGDISTNSLYLIVFGSQPAGATAGASNGIGRIRFTDA